MAEYVLSPLPYDYAALEPHIDATTMQIHHDKHHQAYVNNLNAAIKDYPNLQYENVDDLLKNLSAVPESARTAVRNNGGGHANHKLYWEILTPGGSKSPVGSLATAIASTFGGTDSLIEKANDAGLKRFGSGWSWLATDGSGGLRILSTANQDSPLSDGLTPLIAIDVWEHAYYLKYQNRRPDYLKAIWNVINWDVVGQRYEAAIG